MENNIAVTHKRRTIQEQFADGAEGWTLSGQLFGNTRYCDIHDFEEEDYIYFLDHVRSRDDLLTGLCELSPFADDALDIAERMNDQDFYRFKLALACERGRARREEGAGESVLPKKYGKVVLPTSFLKAHFLAEKFAVSLGVALIRMFELEIT